MFLLYVLIRASLHLVSSLLVNSITNWANLEKKFHTYFYTRTGEKKITDLTTIRQKTNESGIEFLQRFRETRNLCFSLNLADDQLAALVVQGMLPMWKEKLLGQEFDNLGQLAQRVQRSMANSRVCAEIPDFRRVP